jgi:hypothetical protein
MDKTLNDKIEGIFRGLVFVIFDSVTSLWIVATRPLTGPVRLAKRVRQKNTDQVKPYVFVFLGFISLFLVPLLLNATKEAPDPYAYKFMENGHDTLNRDSTGKVFDLAVERFEARSLLPVAIAAILGVSILHLGLACWGRIAYSNPFSRSLNVDKLFFLTGAQVFLTLLATAVNSECSVFETYRPYSLDGLIWNYGAIFAPEDRLQQSRWLYGLDAAMVTWILLLPMPTALRFAQRDGQSGLLTRMRFKMRLVLGRFANLSKHTRHRKPVASLLVTCLLACAATLCFDSLYWFSGASATLFMRKVSPPRTPPYRIDSVEGELRQDGSNYVISAKILVVVSGTTAWDFTANDFRYFIGAQRLDSDPKPKRLFKGSDPSRIGLGHGNCDNLQVNDSSGSTLVEPGRWKSFTTVIKLPQETIDALRQHPEDNRITIFDANDNPAGRQGPLARTGFK